MSITQGFPAGTMQDTPQSTAYLRFPARSLERDCPAYSLPAVACSAGGDGSARSKPKRRSDLVSSPSAMPGQPAGLREEGYFSSPPETPRPQRSSIFLLAQQLVEIGNRFLQSLAQLDLRLPIEQRLGLADVGAALLGVILRQRLRLDL